MRIKLFEGFSKSHPQYTEQEIKKGMEDCLVELNDGLSKYEYDIDIDLNDNYICVVIKSIVFFDESEVPDDEYWYFTKTFDCLEISESVLLLENYIEEKFDRVITEYWFYKDEDIATFHHFPTFEELYDLDYVQVDCVHTCEKLIIKYRLNQ